ncbi:hypothetical protein PF005_g32529, partial [Phytophthora fragariae]
MLKVCCFLVYVTPLRSHTNPDMFLINADPLPVDAVVKAKTFLTETQNHRIVNARASGRPARIFLTARRLWCNRG